MKLGFVPENFVERLALGGARLSGMMPPAVFEAWFGMMLTRTMMVATKVGIFEALANGPLAAGEVAARCGTHVYASEKLLNALVSLDCLSVQGERYVLRRSLRAWILKDGKYSCRDLMLFHFLEWQWWEHCEEYVRTGKPLSVHKNMTEEDWEIYQRGMRAAIEMPARWVARQLPLPRTARQMLDIGGSHGYFSVTICRRHPQLSATVLDLAEAVEKAAPLLAKEGMGDRIVHRSGNALTDELGTNAYDLVFLASLVHHFDEATNRQLMARIARALRPGGMVAIFEPVRVDRAGRIRQGGALFDLYFGFSSEGGTWSAAEVASWFRQADLEVLKRRQPRMMPDLALHIARKPG